MSSIFRTPKAPAFLGAVFLNAFIDLGHKIVIQNTVFKVYDGAEQIVLTAVVNAMILLPFILLFRPSGYASDRFAKHEVMRRTAWMAVGLTSLITLFYYLGWFWPAFAMTFLLAAQSAFYSPAKFGYIRGFFGKDRLAQANGVVSAVSIVAILMGTLAFSIGFEALLPEQPGSEAEVLRQLVPIGFILVLNSLLEVWLTYRLPQTDMPAPCPPFDTKSYLRGNLIGDGLKPVLEREVLRLPMIGLALFWSIGQILLAAFPDFLESTTGESNTIVIQGLLAFTGVGIALGSMIASRVSQNYIETGLIPIGAIGISLGLCVLPQLSDPTYIAAAFLWIGCMGGLFIVPLNALIQYNAGENELGRVLASNNLVQNVSMLSFLILTAAFAWSGWSSTHLLTGTAILAIVGGGYTVLKLPQSLVRFLFGAMLTRRYRVEVQGMKNIPNRGGVLLLGNHISWIDWAIVQIACPRPVQFVMLKSIYERWYLKWFFKLFGCVPIEPGKGSQGSLEVVAELLDAGKVVCLFPEGAISRSGHLGEFRRGFERSADMCETEITIVPFYLRGLWGSQFSRASDELKQRGRGLSRRELVVAFGMPMEKTTQVDALKRAVFDLSLEAWQRHADTLPTLPRALIDAVKQRPCAMALADASKTRLSSHQLLAGALAFSRALKPRLHGETVGIVAPSSAGAIMANFACWLQGKAVANLNVSLGAEAVRSSVAQGEIRTVLSSRQYEAALKKRGVDLSEGFDNAEVVYLEDLRSELPKPKLLMYWLMARLLPASVLARVFNRSRDANAMAALMFSSGSEGAPKAVMLSHRNLVANVQQIGEVLNMDSDDVMMASLPAFHAFGLTATQLMPLLMGMPVVCHPDPLDALGIAKAVARYRATILCGTSSFLRLYTRDTKIHPLMMDSLRLVISGAERLQPQIRDAFKAKFNRDILEGYGATETTPVASVNVPDYLDVNYWKAQPGRKLGSVGMPLPGTSIKIVDPDTFTPCDTDEAGMVLIGGAQVMLGYFKDAERSANALKVIDGQRWYVTGDKGQLDADGFLTIVDRYARFAKVGGEMVSLSRIENLLTEAFPSEDDEGQWLAVAIDDAKKGQRVVVLSTAHDCLPDIHEALKNAGMSAVTLPAKVEKVSALPLLGSGKIDFRKARRLAIGEEE